MKQVTSRPYYLLGLFLDPEDGVTCSPEISVDFQRTIRCHMQKIELFITTVVRTSDPTQCNVCMVT
jgi:hypothetical protein